jgi:hypothetical protein
MRRCPSQRPAADAPADDVPAGYLTFTRLGKHVGLSNVRAKRILAELGWIEKYREGRAPTGRGNALGANVREMRSGTPYVAWPESILRNAALRASVNAQCRAFGYHVVPASHPGQR